MLDALLVLVGATLVVLVFVDAFMTTLAVSAGAGPVSSRLLALVWRVSLRFHHRDARSSFLSGVGTVILTMAVLVWVTGLWVGWSAVFLGSESVVASTSRRPAGPLDVMYFSGFTVFTLGTGDFVADSPGWRLVSAVASFSGLFLITLAITYLISVISAVVARRALAAHIQTLGESTAEIVARGWDGERFTAAFEQQLVGLTSTLIHFAEQHLAYPVLHYFHASEPRLSAPRAIAQLDDVLLLLSAGVVESHRPDLNAVEPLREGVKRYITTASGIAWVPPVHAPPAPRCAVIHDAGIPAVPELSFLDAVARDESTRTQLHKLVASDGWSWPGDDTSPLLAER